MKNQTLFKNRMFVFTFLSILAISVSISICGCSGYSSQSLYPTDVKSVRVEMFDNQTFRRGIEYKLSNALPKRIEANTPYKVITSKDRADTVMSGQITSAGQGVLVIERETGRALEKEITLRAIVNWKDLKTGQLLIDNETIQATATYSEWQNQSFEYAYTLAANKLAVKIVERMEKKW